ncbi:hypothetical protein TSUD_169440 [Trifolium subterraneum]|nr:hypothetical protein TSUD_169440 [Trifolium subterraneum]
MDFNNFSSSSMFSSDDIRSSTERETGWWKFGKISKDHDSDQGTKPMQAVSKFSDGNEVNIIAAPCESSLFSMRLSTDNALYGRSVDTNASEKLDDSLEELEAQIIGNLLPNEDDLLSGVTDWNDHIVRDSTDSVLKALFEQFGDIHTFYRACKHQGLAMISYYDIRASQNAMKALHNRLFGRKKFEIHYSIPKVGCCIFNPH